MPSEVSQCLLLSLLLPLLGRTDACLQDISAAYRFTGIVCRLTYPAAAVLNEKTTKVIEAAFQHARYPSMQGEQSLLFVGKVLYGLDNLEIHNLSIGRSVFELRSGEGIGLEIGNVSAVFSGTVTYGYGSWLVNVANTLDFEIETQIDLGINPKLYCGNQKVAADTSDCYLNFHKFRLYLQGDKEPNWLKKLFTDFITLTVKLVVKGQICKEINKLADILAEFIQDTAAHFLSDGGISVDIGVTTAPAITTNYIESYHKGLTNYNNKTSEISNSNFHPNLLNEDRMLYFWFSDEVFKPLIAAAHQDGRFQLNISSEELIKLFYEFQKLFREDFKHNIPESISKCLEPSASPELRVWSSDVPSLNSSANRTSVWVQASGELRCGIQDTPILFFQTNVSVDVTVSYADKKLFLHGKPVKVFIISAELPSIRKQMDAEGILFLEEAVTVVGIPKVLSVLQVEITTLMDKQGANLFDILNPEVLHLDGYVLTQMDFGFPHHLLVDFLKRTLQ